MNISEETYNACHDYIVSYVREEFMPVKLGIICGSGLGGLAESIDTKCEIQYKDLVEYGFAESTVVGHAGKLVFGYLGEKRTKTVFMVGRFHFYEGHSLQQCTFPVRVMKKLGVEAMIVTNAAGGLNPNSKPGHLMVINDHFSLPGLAGQHPLMGLNMDSFGTRFPAMSDAYNYALRKIAFRAAMDVGIKNEDIFEGVYAFVGGPSYETRVESRFLQSVGVDAVGMSTVPEVVVAHHCGIKVLGISLITNAVVVARGKNAKNEVLRELGQDVEEETEPDTEEYSATHEEVLEAGQKRAADMQNLVKKIADLIHSQPL